MKPNVLIRRPETVQEMLVNATRVLGAAMEYHEARLQAELLLAHAIGTTRAGVLTRLDEPVAPELAARFAANVARRAKHEPLAYIVGRQEFCGLEFIVDRRVLIPRHESELLVMLALERMRSVPHVAPTVVDVGTGSGALALALARRLERASVIATDVAADALVVARLNASRLGLERVDFRQGDLLEGLSEPFDALVANLPYIPSSRFRDLPREVRVFEPRTALDGGVDGLRVIQRLLGQLATRASPGAVAFFEISEEQGAAVLQLFETTLPRARVILHRDLEGLDRVIEAQFQGRD
ncbi:MAG: peptide chain release factor N(5)-glutamine methyltransferase [Chloroflexi bacterium]|nr:peptide chain release factor N(5)-glutamine methyltransferase [Chloroflexota bacterium]